MNQNLKWETEIDHKDIKSIKKHLEFVILKKSKLIRKNKMGRPETTYPENFEYYLLKYFKRSMIEPYSLDEFALDVKMCKTTLAAICYSYTDCFFF